MQVLTHNQDIYNNCRLSYNEPSILWFSDRTILSGVSTTRRSVGRIAFLFDHSANSRAVKSPFLAGIMDDFSVGGPVEFVNQDVASIAQAGEELGSQLKKCVFVHSVGFVCNSSLLSSFIQVYPPDASLLVLLCLLIATL